MNSSSGYPFRLIKNALPFNYSKLEESIKTDLAILRRGIFGAVAGYYLTNAGIICIVANVRTIGLTVEYIKQKFNRICIAVSADIYKESNCKNAIQKVMKTFRSLDVFVNNAGVHYPADDILNITGEQLIETLSVNIFAMFRIAKFVLPFMKQGSNIINTSSVTAYRASAGVIDYSSTKGAIVSFTRSLSAKYIDKGIRVNGVAPELVWTPLIPSSFPPSEVAVFGTDTPMKRPDHLSEISPAFVFPASADASYIYGKFIHINGGEIVNG